MIYRRANHEDISFVVDLEKALDVTKPDSPYWEKMSVLTHPMLPIERVTVAEDAGKVVGMVGAIPLNEDGWYLVNLYVDPSYRGAGVARELVNAAANEQRAAGRTSVMAIVADKVGDLYDKLGFHQIGRAMEWKHQ